MHYRPEIDGLRAVAVLAVLFYHAGFSSFGGGFIGVDVFFVISGYLITSIICHERESNSFSLWRFYERRVRRILPALYAVCLVCIPLTLHLLPPHSVKDFFQSVFSVATFSSNIFFYVETDYFNDFSETAPLLHTWSLAVEEQFYLIFPALLLLTGRPRNRVQVGVVGALTLASLGLSIHYVARDPNFAFYMLPTRFWELGIGALLALWPKAGRGVLSGRLADALGVAGLAMVAVSVWTFSKNTPFPGASALLPVVGTALVIQFTTGARGLGRVLAIEPLRRLGLISYSLYLVHQPIFVFFRVTDLSLDRLPARLLAIAVSFGLAWLSYRLVELPFRVRQVRWNVARLGLIVAVGIGLATAGYVGHVRQGFKKQLLANLSPELARSVIDFRGELKAREVYWGTATKDADRPFAPTDTQRILILGDSKSQDLYVASTFMEPVAGRAIRLLRLDDACMFSPDLAAQASAACRPELDTALNSPLLAQADLVILTATWPYASIDNVAEFVGWLVTQQKRIKLVSTGNFNDMASLSYVIAKKAMTAPERRDYLFRNIRQDWLRQSNALRARIEEDGNGDRVTFLDKLDLFCDLPRQQCELFDGARWIVYDTGHLTVKGAQEIAKVLTAKGWFE